MAVIIAILSIFITYKICKVMFQNTVGTTMAYAKRAFVVWIIVAAVLAGTANSLGWL